MNYLPSQETPEPARNTGNSQTLLFVRDKANKIDFLIDSGAAISVLPASKFTHPMAKPERTQLQAANGARIETFGEKLLKVNLGLRRDYLHVFVVADVQHAIVGSDFLSKYNICIDLANKRIFDQETRVSHDASAVRGSSLQIAANAEGPHVEILKKFPSLTSDVTRLAKVNHGIKHTIPTFGKLPSFRPRKLNPTMMEVAKNTIEKMLEEGVIEPSNSPYASPIHLVPKKQGWRLCGDYRALNSVTEKDAYPLPFLQDFSLQLHGKRIFSKIDLKDAFHQLPIHENDVRKTCICTPFGSFNYLRLPFGLSNAAQSFQRFIDITLRDLKQKYSGKRVCFFAYIDDIIVASESEEEHERDLEAVFQRLCDHSLKISLLKCEFAKEELEFLGHLVSEKGISPLPDKVEAVKNFPRPETYKQLRRFLGMINYYHRFIPMAAEILAPLNKLLEGYKKSNRNRLIVWDTGTENAFSEAKRGLAEASVLAYPEADATLGLFCDASAIAVGGVLQQFRNNGWVPIAFFSRRMSKSEQLGSAFSRELLAMYLSVKHFNHWLEGYNVVIYTDHKPLLGAMKKPLDRGNTRETRQLAYVAQYTTQIEHIPGTGNIVADTLSRPQIDSIFTTSVLDHELRNEIIKLQGEDDETIKAMESSSLQLEKVEGIWCDVSQGVKRPYVPKDLRQRVFKLVHNLAHPGTKQTSQLICQRFVWPSMKKEIKEMVRTCYHCQVAKVTKHNHSALKSISNDVQKFGEVNIDIVGPLPSNKGYSYLFTMIDRFTRWPEVVPIMDIRAETIANAFMMGWVARFGAPEAVVTDRGSQFESSLFNKVLETIGCTRKRTTSYNPRSNGLIERFHRSLKSALKNGNDRDWIDRLPLILLSLRVSFKAEIGCSPSEVVYGYPIRLPVDLLHTSPKSEVDVGEYVKSLKTAMDKISQPVTRPPDNSHNGYVDPKLQLATHVFVRSFNSTGLQPSYRGPYEVVAKNEKWFEVLIKGKKDKVAIDRLKTAHLMHDPELQQEDQREPAEWVFAEGPTAIGEVIIGQANEASSNHEPQSLNFSADTSTTGSTPPSRQVSFTCPNVTRSGRNVRVPDFYQAGF